MRKKRMMLHKTDTVMQSVKIPTQKRFTDNLSKYLSHYAVELFGTWNTFLSFAASLYAIFGLSSSRVGWYPFQLFHFSYFSTRSRLLMTLIYLLAVVGCHVVVWMLDATARGGGGKQDEEEDESLANVWLGKFPGEVVVCGRWVSDRSVIIF